jgi:DNA-binding MarR family transcriptional regulator
MAGRRTPDPTTNDPSKALFPLPCACQSLRRLTRVVTRIYDRELRKANIEITQFGLLTALAIAGEANQKKLSAGFAMDSTTLTRTLAVLGKQRWIEVKAGTDRREKIFHLTAAGRKQLEAAQAHWEAAERRLRKALGRQAFEEMRSVVSEATIAAAGA